MENTSWPSNVSNFTSAVNEVPKSPVVKYSIGSLYILVGVLGLCLVSTVLLGMWRGDKSGVGGTASTLSASTCWLVTCWSTGVGIVLDNTIKFHKLAEKAANTVPTSSGLVSQSVVPAPHRIDPFSRPEEWQAIGRDRLAEDHMFGYHVWLGHLVYVSLYWLPDNPSFPCPEYFTWCYADTYLLGHVTEMYNYCGDIVVGLLLILINLGSILQSQIQISAVTENEVSRRRERNLFVQCLFSSFCYLLCCGVFVYVNSTLLPVMFYPVLHLVWVSMHMDSSVIYLLVNKELRKKVASFWKKETTTTTVVATPAPSLTNKRKTTQETAGMPPMELKNLGQVTRHALSM